MQRNPLYLVADRDRRLDSFCRGTAPRVAYDPDAVKAFKIMGRRILQHPLAREFPDLVTFGFKCSRSIETQQEISPSFFRSGVGTVLHIAPGNIPMNFAYSLFTATMAGNASVVRLPSKEFPQVELFLEILNSISDPGVADFFLNNVRFFRSSREDAVLEDLIARLDGIVVWGGDAAVRYFRSLPKPPNSREVYFPDRKSSAVLNAPVVLQLNESELKDLSNGFFNDTYLVDQNACSSPSTVIWVGSEEDSRNAAERFWNCVHEFLQLKYRSTSTVSLEKLNGLLGLVESIEDSISVAAKDGLIWRFRDPRSRVANLRFGQFFESFSENLDGAILKLRGDEQTVTYFGFGIDEFRSQLTSGGLAVDRVCPVGAALDMGIVWDGKDVVSMLSRLTVLE